MWWKKTVRMPPDVEERLLTLERQGRELKLEWESVHDKLVSLVARYNKRVERIASSERQAESENATPTGQTAVMPRAADPISQRILDRRQRHFPQRSGNLSEEDNTQ